MDDVRKRSAGVIVVRPVENEWHVLLLRAYRNWGFPKGLVDPGEESLAAAVRETAEEASLTDLEFRWGVGYRDTEPYAGGKVARYYVAASMQEEVSLPVNPELGRPEHHEFRWTSFAQARSLLPPRLAPLLDWAHSLVTGRSGPRT